MNNKYVTDVAFRKWTGKRVEKHNLLKLLLVLSLDEASKVIEAKRMDPFPMYLG